MKSNTIISLTAVLGLLVSSSTAAPITRRDEAPVSCPSTLSGPSGNAYFAFSSNLSNQVAKQACASCYNGVLANVDMNDLQFLGGNVEQGSWIKSWNNDDYSGSCLNFVPNGGAPSVGVDSACSSQLWPLCVATVDPQAWAGSQRIQTEQDEKATLTSLAVPYTGPMDIVESNSQVASASVSESKADTTGPASPEVTSPRTPEGSEVDANIVDVVVDSNVLDTPESENPSSEAVAPAPEAEVPVAEAVVTAPEAEVPAPEAVVPAPEEVASSPLTEEDLLALEKEQFRTVFEEEEEACSNDLALGEQDPLVNKYVIEKSAHSATCSEASHHDEKEDIAIVVPTFEATEVSAPETVAPAPEAEVPAPEAVAPVVEAVVTAPEAEVPAPESVAEVPALEAVVSAPESVAEVPAPEAAAPAPEAEIAPEFVAEVPAPET
ncbi:hypothetical protein BGZ76_010598, partial [Entomortierella beljakovae]